jgi:hypothetical protein
MYTHLPRYIEEPKERICEKIAGIPSEMHAASWETCVEDCRNACTDTEVASRISSLRNKRHYCILQDGVFVIGKCTEFLNRLFPCRVLYIHSVVVMRNCFSVKPGGTYSKYCAMRD